MDPQHHVGVCGTLLSSAVRAKKNGQFVPYDVGVVCSSVRVEKAGTAIISLKTLYAAAVSNTPTVHTKMRQQQNQPFLR